MLCAANGLASPSWATVGLGDDQQARRVLVDPVDDCGRARRQSPDKLAPAMVEQGVYQRPVAIAGGGMDHEPGRLSDHQ